jgi:hypothetical protein
MKAAIAGGVALVGGGLGAPAVAAAGSAQAGTAAASVVKPAIPEDAGETKKLDRRKYDSPEE